MLCRTGLHVAGESQSIEARRPADRPGTEASGSKERARRLSAAPCQCEGGRCIMSLICCFRRRRPSSSPPVWLGWSRGRLLLPLARATPGEEEEGEGEGGGPEESRDMATGPSTIDARRTAAEPTRRVQPAYKGGKQAGAGLAK